MPCLGSGMPPGDLVMVFALCVRVSDTELEFMAKIKKNKRK